MMRTLINKSQWFKWRLHKGKRLILATASLLIFLGLGSHSRVASNDAVPESGDRIELLPVNPVRLPPLGSLGTYIPWDIPSSELESDPIAEPLYLVISLSDRQVHLYQNEELKNSYPIAVGKEGWETPTGQFNVIQMLKDPYWEHPWTGEVIPPGNENPLGTRWIGFWTDGTNFIGFHGTPNEDLIGQAVSHGCIRMKNDDVVALFEQVDIGTTVIVKQ